MKKIILLTIVTLAFTAGIYAGNDQASGSPAASSVIKGKVLDMSTSEELAGVTIQVEETGLKAYTDIDGNFRIEGIAPGSYALTISYISYKETVVKNVQADVTCAKELEIKLEQKN